MSELRKSLVIGGERYNLAVGQAGEGPPGENTPGKVGVTYLDTSAEVPVLYVCTAAVKSGEQIKCTWVQVGGAGAGSGENANLTTARVEALHGMFKVCAYDDSKDVSGAYAAFKTAFGISDAGGDEEEPDAPVTPEKTLTSISAVYSGDDVAVGTAVTDLTGIVVTAHYSDGTSEPVTGYALSGEIAEGSNTVTVSYGGMTTTFTVTGVAEAGGDSSHEGVSSIHHLAARTDGQTTAGLNYVEPDNGYIIITNTSGHTGLTAGVKNLFAWPLIGGKTYNISISNSDEVSIWFGLCASTLDVTPVKGEITTVTDTVVSNIVAWNVVAAGAANSYTYTAGDSEYLLFWPDKAGFMTITAEVTA